MRARIRKAHDDETPGANSVVLRQTGDDGVARWLRFSSPVEVAVARTHGEVMPALRRIEEAVGKGCYAAGFVAYEAAPAFDSTLAVKPSLGSLPLLWFGLYEQAVVLPLEQSDFSATCLPPAWTPSVSPATYRAAIARIKELIAQGDTYQVNYTWRLRSPFRDSPWALFRELYRIQEVPYAAYMDIGDHVFCSVSPELFFSLDGCRIATRPMKGTASRGLSWDDDEDRRLDLRRSSKNRAENLMIVDMMRNDLGRIARTGSVRVPRLFEVERYRTLFQMTSTVCALTDAPIGEIFRALFPSPSVTGAPKVRTMQIIAGLEDSPRGVYTGAMGFFAPDRKAQFNVSIRTVHVDRAAGSAEYGTGGGITWDSVDDEEHEECCTKGLVLTGRMPPFELLETLLWKPVRGYSLLSKHLDRLSQSAQYFGFPFDDAAIRRRLEAATLAFDRLPQRVRLLLDAGGNIRVESQSMDPGRRTWKVTLAQRPVDSGSCFLYHKTTNRAVYEQARADFPQHDDVILWNEKGEVTESCVANVLVRIRGAWITPPVLCGLLAGVYRRRLLERGLIREGVVRIDELKSAERLCLINSVRGRIPCRIDAASCVEKWFECF